MGYIEVKELFRNYKVKEQQGFFTDLFKPKYRVIDAVKDVSFSVNKGELIGFIGPNGAGKTTTIKMLTGILWPSSGAIYIAGREPYKNRKTYLKTIGAVFGQRKSMWPELSVRDNLELIGSFYGLKKVDVHKRITQLAKYINVSEFLLQPFRKLSLGQQMKAELISSLLHKPSLLFLDEPTIGMDIVAKLDFVRLLQELNEKEGITIFLTSHDLHEVEKLCKRIIVINRGEKLYDGNVKDIIPDKVIVSYEFRKRLVEKEITRKDLKKIVAKLPVDEFSVREIPLEEVIEGLYR